MERSTAGEAIHLARQMELKRLDSARRLASLARGPQPARTAPSRRPEYIECTDGAKECCACKWCGLLVRLAHTVLNFSRRSVERSKTRLAARRSTFRNAILDNVQTRLRVTLFDAAHARSRIRKNVACGADGMPGNVVVHLPFDGLLTLQRIAGRVIVGGVYDSGEDVAQELRAILIPKRRRCPLPRAAHSAPHARGRKHAGEVHRPHHR